MASRSRGGCIDCKKAKVKCDEVHPRCGTCHRRGYVCQGYLRIDIKGPMGANLAPPPTNIIVSTSFEISLSPPLCMWNREGHFAHHSADSPSSLHNCDVLPIQTQTSDILKTLGSTKSATDDDKRPKQTLLYLNSISHLPPGTISSYDGSVIEVYFSRHSTELVISSEFAEEMNSNVLKVFYNDPQAVCDPLSAIGHIYMGHDSKSTNVPVLNRKARILRRLRTMSGVSNDLEKTVVLSLGLCALEVSLNWTIISQLYVFCNVYHMYTILSNSNFFYS